MAQDSRQVDSLKSVVENSSGKEKFDALVELFIQYSSRDYQVALRYANEAYDLSLTTGDSLSIVMGGRMRANALTGMGRNDEAIRVLTEVLPIAKRNDYSRQVIFILNSIALSYTNRGSYDKALSYHFESLAMRENEGDKGAMSISYNNIGLVYYRIKNFEKALEYYQKSLELKKATGDSHDLDRLYANIGLCYNFLGNYDQAISNFNLAFETCDENCSDDIKKEVYNGLGMAYAGIEDYERAEDNHLRSLALARESEDYRFQTINLLKLGQIALATGTALDEAKLNLLEAKELGERTDHVEALIDIYKVLSSLYLKLDDFKNASLYQGKYIHIKDSIYNDNLISNLATVQNQYEQRKNIQTIADKESALSRQRLLNIAVIIIAVLAGLLVFVLYRSNMITRKVNADLSDAKSIIENQNRELTKSKSELEVKVDLRTKELSVVNESLQRVNGELDNFIYKTSHDIRGPLASLQGICNVALMDVKDQMAIDYLKKLDFTASKLNTILTRLLIINQINNSSPIKREIDFESMVNDVLLLERKKGLPSNLEITYDIESHIHFMSDTELVRIVLENLIDNAIKFHNDSDRIDPFVKIYIRNTNPGVSIHVIDNGIGVKKADSEKIFQIFSRASERSETGGIGLYLSKLASEKLGGVINFRTTPEGFTEFYAEFPTEV